MAGKDYKVQKKAKEQQRLSVFQPAFRWGGNNNNAATSSGSSSKIEAKKIDRLEVNRNDKLDRRQNERVDQPRRNNNRLPIQEDPEAKMARDAKRMTTFQPMFSSLFSSKPSSKGKGPETAQLSQAQRPLANGQTSQYPSRNQTADPARYGASNAVTGNRRGGRSGSGYQNGGNNPRRNEAAAGSSGMNGRGGLAPVPEGDSPRPRSPLQRNPAITKPDDDMMPLGISNPFGPGGRAEGKANGVSHISANNTAYASTGNTRDPRSNGQDRGVSNMPSSMSIGTRDNTTLFHDRKGKGVNTEQNAETQRDRLGNRFQRDDQARANQPRLVETPVRKPVESKSQLKTDPREPQQQMDGSRRGDGKPAQEPAGRSQDLPQVIVTDTSNVPSSGASGRLDLPSKGQQSMNATTSKNVPDEGRKFVRETSGPGRPDIQASYRTDEVIGKSSRSPLDRIAQTLSSKPAQDTRGVALGNSQGDQLRGASSKQAFSQAETSKPGLSVFSKNSPTTRQRLDENEPVKSKSKGLDLLRPSLGREESNNSSQARRIREVADTQDFASSARLRSDAAVSVKIAPNPPIDAFSSSSSRHTPRSKSSGAPENLSRDVFGAGKSEEKKQVAKESLARHKPGQLDETASGDTSAIERLGRIGYLQTEERVRPREASQPSRTVPSPLEPGSLHTEKTSQAEFIEPKFSRTGWASRFAETTSRERSRDKPHRSEKKSDKEAFSTDASRDLISDQDGQTYNTTQPSAAENGVSSFKQRTQEGLGISTEKDLVKPLKSKFSGPKEQETSQPVAGNTTALQTGGTPRLYQQPRPSMTLDKPVKEWKPYAVSKPSVVSGSKPEASKNKTPFVEEWLSSNNSATPSRPDRPQDELFMGVSGSNPRSSPLVENTSPLKISQPLPSSDPETTQKSPRDITVPLSEVKTDRPDPLITRKLAEAVQSSKPEKESREYTLVTAGTPVILSSDTSKRGETKTPAVRIVSGIIERPREIEIQKPTQADKAIRPSKREQKSHRIAAEKLGAGPSRKEKNNETRELDLPPGDAAPPLQVADPSIKQKTKVGNRSRDQGRRVDSDETRKLAPVDDQWPRPTIADSTSAGSDNTNPPSRIDGKKTLTFGGTEVSVSGDPASVDADASAKPGMLGRWTGRGKKDKTLERTKQSLIDHASLLSIETPVDSSLTPASSTQRLTLPEGPEVGVPVVRPGQRTRDYTDTSSMLVMEKPSSDILASGTTQKATFGSLAAGKAKEKSASPSIFKSPISASQNDEPAPLFIGGSKPGLLGETVSRSREGFVPFSPPEAEKQVYAKGRPADRDMADRSMLHKSRAGDSNITSPEMPSQEDFFKQMRQSVMFQNSDSIKMDFPESTDATTKRKSRRNRNVSISGLQPAPETVVPDLPTLSNSELRSAVGGGNSITYSDVPQATSVSWLEPMNFEKPERRETPNSNAPSELHVESSRAKLREEGPSNTQLSAFVLGGKAGVASSDSPHINLGDSSRSPMAEGSTSSMLTRMDEFASPQPSSSDIPSSARVERTAANEMAQADLPNISTNERRIPDALVKPATHNDQHRVDSNLHEQVDRQISDLKYNSWSPPEPIFSKRRPGQSFGGSAPAASRDPEYDIPTEEVRISRATDSGRTPLHPAPSSAGIFRRPSFSNEEGLQQPMTTYDLPAPESRSDPKIQNFFDGLFKSKKNEDLALRLGSTHLTERELTEEQAGKSANDDSVKRLSESPQTQSIGVDTVSRGLNGVSSSPSPVSRDGHAIRMTSGPSEVDPHSPLNTLSRTQEPMQALSVISTPMTPYEPVTRNVEPSDAPREFLTSKSPEASEPLIKRNSRDMSSPHSVDVHMLVVEDVSAHPLSRGMDVVSRPKSPEDSRELEQPWQTSKIGNAEITPRMDHGTPGSFATKYFKEEKHLPQNTSDLIQDKDSGQTVVTPHATSETHFQDFLEDKSVTPGQPDFMVGKSHANDVYISSGRGRDADGSAGQIDVASHRSPVFVTHEDRQKGCDSPSEPGGSLEEAAAPVSFDSSPISHKAPLGIDSYGSYTPSWKQSPEEESDPARPSKFHDEPKDLKLNGYRDQAYPGQQPRSEVGLINSPQESDPDLSDHILSLYGGSESIGFDHQSAGGFPQNASSSERQGPWSVMESAHTKSMLDLHSPVTDHRASVSSNGTVFAENPKMSALPSDVNDSFTPERSTRRLSASEPFDGSTTPVLTPTRDASNPINAETENVGQELPKPGGFKDKLRSLFSKTNNSEPGHESHVQPVEVSSVHQPIPSPEPSDINELHGDNQISTDYASPILESRAEETGHDRDRASFEGANFISPRSEDDIGPGFLAAQIVKEEHPAQMAMSPEPHSIHTTQLDEAKERTSSLRSAYSPDSTPAMTTTGQWDRPLTINNEKDEVISPENDRLPLRVSPGGTGNNDGHFSHENDHRLHDMEELNTQGVSIPRDEKFMGATSLPDSQLPDDMYASTTLRGSPDLENTGHNWSAGPEEGHNMFNGSIDKSDTFDRTTPHMEPMSETHTADDYLQMSLASTTHSAGNEDSRDVPMVEEENTLVSSPHLSGPDISSPGLEHDGFQSGESPMPKETTHWANKDLEQIQDRYQGSPQSDHMGVGPANVMETDDPLEIRSRSHEGERWSDTPVQTGSFSPAVNDGNHVGDSAMMVGSAEPDFDAATEYSDDHGVRDSRFTADHGNAQDDLDDTANDVHRVEDYEHGNQGFGHLSTDGSTFGNDEIHDEVDDLGGDQGPAHEFPGYYEEFNGIESDSYPDDHQLGGHEGGFNDFEDGRLPADDFNGHLETSDGPRIENCPTDHQTHEGGFDDFQDDKIPADDFNDRRDTFNSSRMESYPVDDLPPNDVGFADQHGPASDFYQDDSGGLDEIPMDHYPADGPQSPGAGFEESTVDNYPVDDFQRHSGAFGGPEMDGSPADDFPCDTAEPNNSALDNYEADSQDGNHGQYSEPTGEEMPSYEQDHDAGYPSDGVDGFNPGHDDVPYDEAPLSDYGGEQGPSFDQEPEPLVEDDFHEDYHQDSPLDECHFGNDDLAGGQPEFEVQGDGMGLNDNKEGEFEEMPGEGFGNQDHGADADYGLDDEVDHFNGEPSWEGDAEPSNFDEGGFGDEGEPPIAADWDADQVDEGRGEDEAEEYSMDGGEDFPTDGGADYPMEGEAEDYPLDGDESRFPDAMEDGDLPMGGEAEEYYMGGEGMQFPDPIDGGDFPMGGEAEDYLMGGDEEAEYPMETMDEGDNFPMEGEDNYPVDGDEELPIGDMYGEEERSMEPIEDEEFPMGDDEASTMMDGGEYPTDGEEDFPMEGEEYPMDEEEGFPMDGEDVDGSDRGIEDFDDADGQLGDDMSDHASMPHEEQGSQFDDGSVEAHSLIDEEAGSETADEEGGSDVSDPFDEEPIGDFDGEDEDLATSEVEDREIEDEEVDDDTTSLAGEEDVDVEEEQDMDDLYEADVPSIPASPTLTNHDRELASPAPTSVHEDDSQDEEEDIFGEPALQEDLADLENADPVRLSCLYMQDVGLMSSPASPTVPQASDNADQNEAEEEEQPREPVRFSALYRQSLDWSQALDASMWENDDESLPEEDELESTAPVLEAVPESAKRTSHEDLRMLEVDQEPLTPVAASPLSPRPLETPPPDYDHSNGIETHQLVDEPEEMYKSADDNGHPQYSVSPRLQPTPPPDQDQSPVSNDSQDDRRDSRGPLTFDEMNLPRRVISPPNTGDDDDSGGPAQAFSSTNIPMHNSRRSISQRFSGWWTGGGSSAQVPARPPPLPAPYDSRYGEPSSPI